MSFFDQLISDEYIDYFYQFIADWGFTVAVVIFVFELLVLAARKMVTKNVLGDAVANFLTLGMFIVINAVLLYTMYISAFYWVYLNVSVTHIPTNLWTILGCIVLADIAYYWEHRFVHRVGFGWASHAVHHSSPHFNISVAYRFGPLDGLMPFLFHIPLVLLGFNPLVVFFAEMLVQLYQTLLHTEVVRKMPRPIETIFNTPSHHRVHHGSNPQYIDKNYAGVFIIWDKLFNTFEKEHAKVIYGITKPINTINPLKVFFFGYIDLFKQVFSAPSFGAAIGYLLMPPGWQPKEKQQGKDSP